MFLINFVRIIRYYFPLWTLENASDVEMFGWVTVSKIVTKLPCYHSGQILHESLANGRVIRIVKIQ
jgi:hypothetical protein